jgi:predicted ATPase
VREFPSGTVTFLFTDIEGSTRLLRDLGDAYVDALAEHRRVLREAFQRHGGVEVDAQGDAFFVAFARATDAVAAAAEAQEALRTGPIRVRIGLHTGEPLVTEEGYVGMDVHRGARIAAAGHGGQVLLSQTTRDLLDAKLELRYLGEHRLKDLSGPQRLYQLRSGDFPPLKTLHQANLPVQPTPLIGRERELAEVLDLVRAHRLVTLTGSGGSGKTRLGLQAAAELVEELRDGVWFISLAGVRDPELVEPTIAQTFGVREPQSLADDLTPKETLLLLDNFEHLLAAAPKLIALLAAAPHLKLLVTSRACLRVSGEREYPVLPLVAKEAVTLFTERARAVNPGFEPNEHVSQICRRVDNLPLAIELAAARVRVLTPEAMLGRLEQRLPLLVGGTRDAPERQRTLRATIEWSYDLLAEQEQELFRRLGVFAGSFALEAAEAVCAVELSTIEALLEKNLLRQTQAGRFFMLETIREFALERLAESVDEDTIRRRHAQYFLGIAEHADAAFDRPSFPERAAVVEREHDNFRGALEWALEQRQPDLALALVSALGRFWWFRGYPSEGLLWVKSALALSDERPTTTRARAFRWAAMCAREMGSADAVAYAEESARIFRALGDDTGLEGALATLGGACQVAGDLEAAQRVQEEGEQIARSRGDPTRLAWAVHNLGLIALQQGDRERARPLLEESLGLWRRIDVRQGIANSLCDLGFLELHEGRRSEALELLREALRAASDLGWRQAVAHCLVGVAGAKVAEDPEHAARILGHADALKHELRLKLPGYAAAIAADAEAAAREALGDQPYEAAAAAGRATELDQAIEEALRGA